MAKLYFYYSAMNAGKTTTLLQSAHNYHERGMRTLILKPGVDTRAESAELEASSGQPPSTPVGRLPPQAGEGNQNRPAADASEIAASSGQPPSTPAGRLPPQAGEGNQNRPAADAVCMVASRIGLKANAHRFDTEENLMRLVERDIRDHGALHCVLVDEAQFLSRGQAWQLSDVVDKLRIPVLAYGLRTDFRGELFDGSRHLLAWADELEEIKTICHSGSKATMVVRVDEAGRAVTDGPQVEIGGNERYVSVSRAEFKKITAGEGRIELQQTVLPLGTRTHKKDTQA